METGKAASGSNDELTQLYMTHGQDIEPLKKHDTYALSVTKICFLYDKLKTKGRWRPDKISTETGPELNTLQSALIVDYGCLFTGPARISANWAPCDLRRVHDEIMELRSKRYGHNPDRESLETVLNIQIDGDCVPVKDKTASPAKRNDWKDLATSECV